jgi:hypothetical protein
MPIISEYNLVTKFGLPAPFWEISAKKMESYIVIANALHDQAVEQQEKLQGKEPTR